MPYIPHTPEEISAMLNTIGVNEMNDLFDEIPAQLRVDKAFEAIPVGISEMEAMRLFSDRASEDKRGICFIGAGAYEHHIPAAVWEVACRGEFLTAYTPYQAEASQGTLQLLYEYQTMMANLMGMAVSNASLYDGASALAEAVLMAVRSQRHQASRQVLYAGSLHPYYRDTVRAIVNAQGIQLIEIPFSPTHGIVRPECLQNIAVNKFDAFIIPQPNFFGAIEDVDQLTSWAQAKGAFVIAVVNPIAMALLKEPGQWGDHGADIACGSGQPLGIPLASGGPYYGFLCCKQDLVRQLPGRLIGRTTDKAGNIGYTLTLQAREQHIRRSKATSNICTNQGLAVTASTIHMSILGFDGLRNAALASHERNQLLIKSLTQIPGVKQVFETPTFHEVVLRFNKPVKRILAALSKNQIQGGFPLGDVHPQYEDCLLICTTEMQTPEDIKRYAEVIAAL